MTQVTWTENVPSGTSAVADAPSYLHAQWGALGAGLATSLYWDGSGGASLASRGELLQGAPRTFVGPFSQSSNADIKLIGRASFNSSNSRLFVYDSTGTYLIGTNFQVKYGSSATTHFVALSGFTTVSNVTTTGTNSVVVCAPILPGTGTGLPLFGITTILCQSSEQSVLVHATNDFITATQDRNLILNYLGVTGAPSSATLSWQVVGSSMFT